MAAQVKGGSCRMLELRSLQSPGLYFEIAIKMAAVSPAMTSVCGAGKRAEDTGRKSRGI